MPYDIKFDTRPAGVCVEAVRKGETVKVRVVEFVSEEDGDTLIDRLEGFVSDFLARLPADPPLQPNQVQHLLAIVRSDNTATVYVNELKPRGMVQVKRDFKAGDAVFADDIADVHRMDFEGVTIPDDAGFLLYFSVGWRRAVFFDLAPLAPDRRPREYDVGAQLAQFYAQLMFQRRFKITAREWKNLFDGQWFPFITLKEATIRKLISHASNDWPLDDLSEAISQEIKHIVPNLVARWKATPSFTEHMPFLEKAAEHYLHDDFISAATMLYPRIEGILRSHQQKSDVGAPASQKGLSASATKKSEAERHASTPLLPSKFREYLEQVYFAAFDPKDPKIKVSRNSVGHGVAAAEECSLKAATIGILLVNQLYHCFADNSQRIRHASGK
jgi:hypothetical protein